MDLKGMAMDELGKVISGATTPTKSGAKTTTKRRAKSTSKSNPADMINTANLGKAAGDVMSSPNKIDGLKKAATDLLDKNGDGNVLDDVIGGFFK
jgi:hypothetical protein